MTWYLSFAWMNDNIGITEVLDIDDGKLIASMSSKPAGTTFVVGQGVFDVPISEEIADGTVMVWDGKGGFESEASQWDDESGYFVEDILEFDNFKEAASWWLNH